MSRSGAPLLLLPRASALTIALTVGLFTAQGSRADIWQPLEAWRIEEGRLAPWAPPGMTVDSAYRGREVRFEVTRVVAPKPLGCEGATYEWLFGDAAGLFEGNLPVPASASAERLGLGLEPFATLRAACPNAGFDFHRTPSGDLLLGLDNVVWTLRATRSASAPAEIVQELLITHFTHDMGFTRDSVALKKEFLSADLRARIERYFAAPQSPDEAPIINGDPFTDSQEYPVRFTLGKVRTTPRQVTVPVNFGETKRRVDYVLKSEGNRWVVYDLVDERGDSLRGLIDVAP